MGLLTDRQSDSNVLPTVIAAIFFLFFQGNNGTLEVVNFALVKVDYFSKFELITL